MDYLQEGIGLRAMAQRDPLVEYQREGYDMFTAMMDAIQEESVGFLFNLEVEIEQAPEAPAEPPPTELDAEAVLASLAAGGGDSHGPGSSGSGSHPPGSHAPGS